MKKFGIIALALIPILTLGIISLRAFSTSSRANALDGSWELESYESGGKMIPVSGLMIFTNGHFGIIYTMAENEKEKSGRGHAGSFTADGDSLNFKIPWWVEYVNGKAMVAKNPIEAKARFDVEENSLIVRFENGSVQKFKRTLQAPEFSLRGSWQMISYEGGGSAGTATGQILFENSSFILIYTMEQKDGAFAGRAHGGKYETKGNALALEVPWSLQYVSGKGSVAGAISKREAHFQVKNEILTITYDNNKAIQKFRSSK